MRRASRGLLLSPLSVMEVEGKAASIGVMVDWEGGGVSWAR